MNDLWNRLISTWDTLSPRERTLLSVAAGALALFLLVVGIVQPLLGLLSDDGEVAGAQQQVAVMRRLQKEYDEVNSRLSAVEARIQSNSDRRNLRTLLDSLARDARVAELVESMEERPDQQSDTYEETRVEVSLRKVTLEQIVKYLHSIESTPRLLSIKGLRIKTRPDKSKLLDVTFSVSSFNPL